MCDNFFVPQYNWVPSSDALLSFNSNLKIALACDPHLCKLVCLFLESRGSAYDMCNMHQTFQSHTTAGINTIVSQTTTFYIPCMQFSKQHFLHPFAYFALRALRPCPIQDFSYTRFFKGTPINLFSRRHQCLYLALKSE